MSHIGHIDEICRAMITGWAVDLERPDLSVDVVAFVDSKPYAATRTNIYREALIKAVKGQIADQVLRAKVTGIYGFCLILDPPLSIFDEQRIEVRVGKSGTALPNSTKVLSQPRALETSLVPVIVTAIGRSGTTLLMQQLGSHPEIVISPLYPFEIKLTAYYTAAFRALVANADRERSTRPNELFGKGSEYWIGSNPYNRPGLLQFARDPRDLECLFNEFIPNKFATAFRAIIEHYYGILRRDQGKFHARYFAEKGVLNDAARKGPRLFFGTVREIVLIRDPRDLLCSAKAFWKTRSGDALDSLRLNTLELMQIKRLAASDTLIVKYEDIVGDRAQLLDDIYRFIGVSSAGPLNADDHVKLFRAHGTSKSPKASIGRWRTDLTKEEIASCNAAFGDFLLTFEYEV